MTEPATEASTEVPTEAADAPQCELAVDEMANSMTGFDELAITKAFGKPLGTLGAHDEFQFLRALIFTHRRRKGDNDATAYKAAQVLPISDVNIYFSDDLVESGKDSSPTETAPSS